VGGEAGVSVQYQALGESEPQVEVFVIELGNLGTRDHLLAGEEYGCPRAPMVNDR